MIKKELLFYLNKVFQKQENVPLLDALEIPKNKDHGDFATPVCFTLAKIRKQSPRDSAVILSEQLNTDLQFKKIAVASPLNGFINMTLTSDFIWSSLCAVTIETPDFPQSVDSILLEYVSANPTGPLHIGHGRWAVMGSVMAHLLRYTRHTVSTEFYINDAGNQITTFYNSVNAAKSGNPIPEDGYHGAYIRDLAKGDKDPLQMNLDDQRQTLERIGVTFDQWFSEKTLHDSVNTTLATLKENGWTYEKDNALWFKTSQLGDEKDRVLIKSDGSYTYFAVDIVYHDSKLKRGFTHLINIWGADHHGYVARVKLKISRLHFRLLLGNWFT
jgi:arginyl-tRNA synthetase